MLLKGGEELSKKLYEIMVMVWKKEMMPGD